MDRDSLIRRAPGIAFAVLLVAALATGGGAALAGLPKFLDAALPGLPARTNNVPLSGPAGAARFALPDGFGATKYAPQVLYPVSAAAYPDWLAQGVRLVRTGPSPALRGQPAARPVIAICIDDLGEDIAGTDRAMLLPKEVALSFLPYAPATPFLAEAAARRGHLILAHVPMQALGKTDPGPMALKPAMTTDEIARRMVWNLDRVPGIAGINNHEGSRFTADAELLRPVAAALKTRGLFFFDSRTGPDSKVEQVARASGVMTAGRDIFLDDDRSVVSVNAQLDALAREAKRNGVAIAIGHPHDVTLTLLAAWLQKDHGVTLVSLDEAMRRKAAWAGRVVAR